MRRHLVAALLLVSFGLAVGSAAGLNVDGGVLQVFRVEADIDVPSSCEPPQGTQANNTSPTYDSPPATDSSLTNTAIGNACPEDEPTDIREDE